MMRPVLGLLITLAFIFLVGYLATNGLKQMNKEAMFLFGAIVQTVILLTKDSFGFYFGSSQGSANKADTIDEMLNGEDGE